MQLNILRITLDGAGEDSVKRSATVVDINDKNLDYKEVDGQHRATLTGGDVMKSFVVPRDS